MLDRESSSSGLPLDSSAAERSTLSARDESAAEAASHVFDEVDARDEGSLESDFLAEAAIRGDRGAQREVWERHRRWIGAILLAHKPRWAELDDLLQEVAVSFVRKVGELRDAGAIKPWLRIVAVNAAHAAARSGKIRAHAVGSFGAEEVETVLDTASRSGGQIGHADDHGPAPLKLSFVQEGRRLLDLASGLPDGYREPLLLKAVQNLSYREIGRILGLPETTVETRIARARKQLRTLAAQAASSASVESGRVAGRGVSPISGGDRISTGSEIRASGAGRGGRKE